MIRTENAEETNFCLGGRLICRRFWFGEVVTSIGKLFLWASIGKEGALSGKYTRDNASVPEIIRLSKAFKYILFPSKIIWSTMAKSSFRSMMSGHIVARKKTHKWTLSFSRFVTKSFLTLMNASSNKKRWAGHSKNAKILLLLISSGANETKWSKSTIEVPRAPSQRYVHRW